MDNQTICWQTYLNLESELLNVAKYIFFTDEKIKYTSSGVISESCGSQLEVFSPYLADLLVQISIQIEAISKDLYFKHGGPITREEARNNQKESRSLYFDTDCLAYVDNKLNIQNKEVLIVSPLFNFTKKENIVMTPLKNAHKRQKPSWKKAYQAIKHDRYYNLSQGNVKNVIHSLGALYLLNVYNRNIIWNTTINKISDINFNMGSVVFAIQAPNYSTIVNDNKPIVTSSPYVVQYHNDIFNKIDTLRNDECNKLMACFCEQPECQDSGFESYLSTKPKKDININSLFIYLAQYRMSKIFTPEMTFQEKKSTLLNSDAWKCRQHQNSNHIKEADINEDNIQECICNATASWGIDMIFSRRNSLGSSWMKLAFKDGTCRVYIPSDI